MNLNTYIPSNNLLHYKCPRNTQTQLLTYVPISSTTDSNKASFCRSYILRD